VPPVLGGIDKGTEYLVLYSPFETAIARDVGQSDLFGNLSRRRVVPRCSAKLKVGQLSNWRVRHFEKDGSSLYYIHEARSDFAFFAQGSVQVSGDRRHLVRAPEIDYTPETG